MPQMQMSLANAEQSGVALLTPEWRSDSTASEAQKSKVAVGIRDNLSLSCMAAGPVRRKAKLDGLR
jgi:hypothetical protein